MRGEPLITIDASDFVRGMSSSDFISDGGFSPDTDGVNLTTMPGAIYAPAAPTDKSTNLVGQIIASSEDPTGTFQRIFVSADATDDGRVFTADSDGDLTLRGSEDTANNYIQGRTDMISYKNEVYITTAGDITRVSDIAGTPTLDTTFMSAGFNDAVAPHPALVYEDNAFYGDGNDLWRQTAAGTPPTVIFTLPAGSVIVALGIDPGSGKMLISYIGQYNVSGTINTQARVGFYDGLSNKLSRTVLVEEMITAFPTAGGVLYVAYGRNLGYWNGSGASFLRRFNNITYDNTELMYKHHFTAIGSTLYFIDNLQIIAHGHITQGSSKVFWPVFKNLVNSNNLFFVTNLGNDLLSFCYSSAQHFTLSTTSVGSTNTLAFRTNMYRFPRPVTIDEIFIEWVDNVAAAATPVTVTYINASVQGFADSLLTMATITNNASVAIRETYDSITGMASPTGRSFRFRFATATNNYGIARVIFYGHVHD